MTHVYSRMMMCSLLEVPGWNIITGFVSNKNEHIFGPNECMYPYIIDFRDSLTDSVFHSLLLFAVEYCYLYPSTNTSASFRHDGGLAGNCLFLAFSNAVMSLNRGATASDGRLLNQISALLYLHCPYSDILESFQEDSYINTPTCSRRSCPSLQIVINCCHRGTATVSGARNVQLLLHCRYLF